MSGKTRRPDSDDEPKTPRESGSWGRWEIHARRCESAAKKLEAIALTNQGDALRKRKVTFELDRKGAEECDKKTQEARDLANRCSGLAQIFMMWEHFDPGLERRLEHIRFMFDLAREAKAFGVDL